MDRITVRKHTDTPFRGHLEVVATLSGRAIEASLVEMKAHDELTVALRTALRNGVGIDELSAESGLAPREIRRRVSRDLALGEDIASFSGISR